MLGMNAHPARLGACLGLALVLAAAPTQAQSAMPGVDEFAEALVEMTTRTWEGPRVPRPEEIPRPVENALALRSTLEPLAVHAPDGVPFERVRATLAALEAAHVTLREAGWPSPIPDGGRGETGGFDVYLVRGGLGADAHADADVPWSFLDAVSSYGVVDASVGDEELAACVTSAYVQAVLMGQDPAEARGWRRATAAWLSWVLTGRYGCNEPTGPQQAEPWRGWIRGQDADGAGGSLLLTMISARHGRGTTMFVRELWQLTRQRSRGTSGRLDWEHAELRAGPDLWAALEIALEYGGDDLHDFISNAAMNRYFVGSRERERGAAMDILRGLGSDATIEPAWRVDWAELPEHLSAANHALEPFGSSYALVDVRDAEPGQLLRVWLRGEYGVEWSLVTARIDAEGREVGRMTAPPRLAVRKSYLPVLLDEDTAYVIVAVTNLSSRLPDADELDENVRSFRLILDRRAEDEAED